MGPKNKKKVGKEKNLPPVGAKCHPYEQKMQNTFHDDCNIGAALLACC